MAKVLSKGIQLGYSTTSSETYTMLTDLVNIPALGSAPEKVDVTTLDDESRHYINGLKDFGQNFDFTFVYDDTNTQFETLDGLKNTTCYWKIQFPNVSGTSSAGPAFTFTGKPAVSLNAVEVGARVEYILSIGLESDIVMA